MTVEQPMDPADRAASSSPQQNPWEPGAPAAAMPSPAYPPATTGTGEVGKVRGTGVCILLAIVTFGIYSLVWFSKTHAEMKRHSGQGIGGVFALLIAVVIGFVSPYLASNEVGGLYERRGQGKPVSALTGLWYFPGVFILVGPIVWFVKTNGALNAYWRSVGAR